MSDSKTRSNKVGFSTGALERGDYRCAVTWLWKHNYDSVELSALRMSELKPLLRDLSSLPVNHFKYVSFHAPSWFEAADEKRVVEDLGIIYKRGWNIIVHPDVIRKPALWRRFGKQLLLENMDRRKPVGRTSQELERLFSALPDARLCLDVAHARQMDTTLTLLSDLIRRFASRIAEVHMSELDSICQHQPMSWCAVNDYKNISWNSLASGIPVIIESMLNGNRMALRKDEYSLACVASHRNLHVEHQVMARKIAGKSKQQQV